MKLKIWEAIAKVIWGSFQRAPLETAFLVLFGTLKFTGIGSKIGGKIIDLITKHIVGAEATSKIAAIGGAFATKFVVGLSTGVIACL